MRRFMVLVTVALLMTAMLVASAVPAAARPIICPTGCDATNTGRCVCDHGGTRVPRTVCELLVDEDNDGIFKWRPGGVCWLNWGAVASGF